LGLLARFDEVNACLESEGNFDEKHDLARTPLEGHYDVFVHEESSSVGSNYVIPNPIEHSHVSITRSQPSFSANYSVVVPNGISKLCDFKVDLGRENNMSIMLRGNVENFGCLGYFSGYDATRDPYWTYLEDKPEKIMWCTFFDFSFDFSMAFGLLQIAVSFFVIILLALSY